MPGAAVAGVARARRAAGHVMVLMPTRWQGAVRTGRGHWRARSYQDRLGLRPGEVTGWRRAGGSFSGQPVQLENRIGQVTCSLLVSGGTRVFVDQSAQDRFSADLLCIDAGHGGAGSIRFVGNVLGDAL